MGLLDSCVLYYKCDETSGTSASDSATTKTGTLGGSSVSAFDPNGKINYGVKLNCGLNGSGTSYITTPLSNDFAFGTGDFSISYWIYRSNTSFFFCPIELSWGVDGLLMQYNVSLNQFTLYSGGSNILSGVGFSLTLNAWTHVVIRRIGTTLESFKNGVSHQTAVNSTNIINSASANYIGSYSGGGQGLNGYMDEIGIWKGYGLSNADIAYLYNSGNGQQLDFPKGNMFLMF